MAALTDLNLLSTYCENVLSAPACNAVRDTVVQLKQKLVDGRWYRSLSKIDGKISDIHLWTSPSGVGWRASLNGFDAQRDELKVVWYRVATDEWDADAGEPRTDKPDKWGIWNAVPSLFQKITPTGPPLLRRNSDGTVQIQSGYRFGPDVCLPAGRYVPEFYLNGILIKTGRMEPVQSEDFVTERSWTINVVFCHPRNRETLNISDPSHRYFFAGNNGVSAAMFMYFAPKSSDKEKLKYDFLRRALLFLSDGDSKAMEKWTLAASRFKGCDSGSSDQSLLHKEWPSRGGIMYVALLMGALERKEGRHEFRPLLRDMPTVTKAQWGEACNILESIGNNLERITGEE